MQPQKELEVCGKGTTDYLLQYFTQFGLYVFKTLVVLSCDLFVLLCTLYMSLYQCEMIAWWGLNQSFLLML